jgi:hypothetical protein
VVVGATVVVGARVVVASVVTGAATVLAGASALDVCEHDDSATSALDAHSHAIPVRSEVIE